MCHFPKDKIVLDIAFKYVLQAEDKRNTLSQAQDTFSHGIPNHRAMAPTKFGMTK